MPGPTTRRWQLGKELRRLREAAGISRERAAGAVDRNPTSITHYESGHAAPSKPILLVLLEIYGADAETIQTLEELRQGASQRGWWSTARLPTWLAAYVGLEADATELRTWATGLIPGLLQTECYARELHRLSPHLTPPADVERRVKARMQRQARLTGPDPLTFQAILDEAALRRCAGQRNIAASQLRHLIDTAQLPNVDLRVLPFGSGLHSTMHGSFTLLTFPHGLLPPVAYQEYAAGGHIIDEKSVVASLDTLYRDELRSQALDASESLALIAEIVDHIS